MDLPNLGELLRMPAGEHISLCHKKTFIPICRSGGGGGTQVLTV